VPGAAAPLRADLDADVRQLGEQAVAERVGPTQPSHAVGHERAAATATLAALPPAGVEDPRGRVAARAHRPVRPDDDVLDEVADDGEAGAHRPTVRRLASPA
jgi:hypothetical protein